MTLRHCWAARRPETAKERTPCRHKAHRDCWKTNLADCATACTAADWKYVRYCLLSGVARHTLWEWSPRQEGQIQTSARAIFWHLLGSRGHRSADLGDVHVWRDEEGEPQQRTRQRDTAETSEHGTVELSGPGGA
jgi:hypothetical protein